MSVSSFKKHVNLLTDARDIVTYPTRHRTYPTPKVYLAPYIDATVVKKCQFIQKQHLKSDRLKGRIDYSFEKIYTFTSNMYFTKQICYIKITAPGKIWPESVLFVLIWY